MNYQTSGAFRHALEDRLRGQSLAHGMPLTRLRKMVAFERFLARLVQDQPDEWVLKGGLALQLRLGNRARTTQDVDLLLRNPQLAADIHRSLVHAALLDLHDWFEFEVGAPSISVGGLRFHVQSLLDGHTFEDFHLDVGSGDPMVEPPEFLQTPSLLDFAEIQSTRVPCYPLTQQIAEKVHAYTRPHPGGASSRVKDWVDLLLIAEMGKVDASTLRQAIKATFDSRGTHAVPTRLPSPPSTWAVPFRKMAQELSLGQATLKESEDAMARFLDPILSGKSIVTWDPTTYSWQ